jgi:quercetin dioxygenase-like cupin family protein
MMAPLFEEGGLKMAAEARHYRWSDVPRETLTPFLDRQFFHGERVMLAHIHMKKGCLVPKHHHENEQLSYVLEGRILFKLGEQGEREQVLEKGDVLVIPGNLPHSAEALVDSLSLDVFSPPRQDWIDGTDAYLRGQR